MQFTNKQEYFQYVEEFKERYIVLRLAIVEAKIAIKDAMTVMNKIPLEVDKWGYTTYSSRFTKRRNERLALMRALDAKDDLTKQMSNLLKERSDSRILAGQQMRARLQK
jgi:hypothetical protein